MRCKRTIGHRARQPHLPLRSRKDRARILSFAVGIPPALHGVCCQYNEGLIRRSAGGRVRKIHGPGRQAARRWTWPKDTVAAGQFPKICSAPPGGLKQEIATANQPSTAAHDGSSQSWNDLVKTRTVRRHFPDGTRAAGATTPQGMRRQELVRSHCPSGHGKTQALLVLRPTKVLDVTRNGEKLTPTGAISVDGVKIMPIAIENGLRSFAPHCVSC